MCNKFWTPFKVVSVSSNTNSFGLYGMILMDRNGITYEVAANSLRVKKRGDVLEVPGITTGSAVSFHFSEMGFEIPTFKGKAPKAVIAEVWKIETPV